MIFGHQELTKPRPSPHFTGPLLIKKSNFPVRVSSYSALFIVSIYIEAKKNVFIFSCCTWSTLQISVWLKRVRKEKLKCLIFTYRHFKRKVVWQFKSTIVDFRNTSWWICATEKIQCPLPYDRACFIYLKISKTPLVRFVIDSGKNWESKVYK